MGGAPGTALTAEKFYTARITERHEVASDLWRVKLDPGGDFNFVAGQYATLGVREGNKLVERAYSIVSSPYEKQLELFFELVPHGELTPALHERQIGDEVSLRRMAKGRFTLDLKSGHKNHFLLSTVTGIAPFVSYARTLYKDWKEELEQIEAEVPWLTYVPTISRPWEDPNWHGETGRVEDLIRKYGDQWGLTGADTTGYLCGHPQMIEHGLGILERRGFPKKSLKQEVYWIPPKAAAT
jgi:ferredoxin--NADP+ reductase